MTQSSWYSGIAAMEPVRRSTHLTHENHSQMPHIFRLILVTIFVLRSHWQILWLIPFLSRIMATIVAGSTFAGVERSIRSFLCTLLVSFLFIFSFFTNKSSIISILFVLHLNFFRSTLCFLMQLCLIFFFLFFWFFCSFAYIFFLDLFPFFYLFLSFFLFQPYSCVFLLWNVSLFVS